MAEEIAYKVFDDQKTYKRADWFEEYWTGERGNYTLAHAEVGGTNNNCGVSRGGRETGPQ
jgi:hypothetical protein